MEKEPQEEPQSRRSRTWSRRQISSLADLRMDVPEVPAVRAPPPPSAAVRTTDSAPVGELRVAMETLGEELCQRVERLLEGTVERVLERNLGSSSLKSLLQSRDNPKELFHDPVKQIKIPEECSCKPDQKERKVAFEPEAMAKATFASRPALQNSLDEGSQPSIDYKSGKSSLDEQVGTVEPARCHKRLRFDEEVVPLASLELDDRMKRSANPDVWPSWAAGKQMREREGFQDMFSSSNSTEKSVKSSRLKVDIRVSFKEIESRGLDTNGNLLDLNNRIMRLAKMPSTVTDMQDYPLLQRFVMHPASNPILVWHIIGPVLLSYDIIMIPMQAFPLPPLLFFAVVTVMSTAYWSLDTLRGFFTGYETDKSVEMRPGMIARKYVGSWFILDFLTCTVDWTFLIMGNVGSFNKFWRTGRAVHAWRLLRLVRLVRVLKFARRISSFMADRITSLQGLITLKSAYIGFGVTFACHYMACYWYLVGTTTLGNLTETNWLKEYSLTNSTLVEVYVSCFHWAMGQSGFTPAEIYPTNTLERLYASYVSFCWLIIVSVTINLFSIWLGHLHEANKDRETQNIYLRKFLDEHEVSKRLTSRVLRCFRANYVDHQPRVHEEDVEFLRDLPVSLKICLRREVFIPVLKKHPFFTFISRVNPVLPIMITYCAMREDRYLAGEVIFAENTPAQSMLYVLTGCLNYYAVQGAMGVTKLKPGDWALEPALWLRWTCRGRLVTEITSELVSIDVEKFMAIMHHVKAKGEDTEYVKRFAKSVCDHFLEYSSSTDLWQDTEEVKELGEEILAANPPPITSRPPSSEVEESTDLADSSMTQNRSNRSNRSSRS